MVQVLGPGVESLVVNQRERRLEHAAECRRHVLDVDDRPPRLAVAEDDDPPVGERGARQVVQDRVEAHPGRQAVDRSVAQEGRREAVAREFPDRLLAPDLGTRVEGPRVERRSFVHRLRAGLAVHDARRREQKATHLGLAREFREPHGRLVVDLLGPGLVQVADRIVRERRQVDHGVEGAQVGRLQVADVLADRRNRYRVAGDRAVVEVAGVEPDDVVAALQQPRRHDRAEVTAVPGDQDRAANEGGTHPATAVLPVA